MLVSTNITNSPEDVARYRDAADMRAFLDAFGLDGLELMPMPGDSRLHCIPPERVVGLHLPFFTSWVDFWNGDEEALMREYGDWDTVRMVFGGDTPGAIIEMLRGMLDFGKALNVKYVVLHVSNVMVDECLADRCAHSDEAVCAATAELVNRLNEGRDDPFDFLLENLWWPGLTMTRPEITRDLMAAIRAPRKGIMLDTGHLLHTNRDLAGESEAVDYILRRLDEHGAAAGWVRGMHLHQSLTGAWTRRTLAAGLDASGDYWTRFGHAMEYVLGVDRHEPFSEGAARRLVARVAPDYLTHEFITPDRRTHEGYLERQGVGKREGLGNREEWRGNREQGTGSREQGTGSREQEWQLARYPVAATICRHLRE